MMKKNTLQQYRQRLLKVVDYIHDHIQDDLDVNTLADVAHLSPYHFHRIYREMMHEPVNATVRRLRLQQAAVDLLRTDQPIHRIAQKVSYGSTEAFTRSFSKQFAMTPSEYRVAKQDALPSDEPFVAMLPDPNDEFTHKRYSTMYTAELIEISELQLIGYPHQGDYMQIGSVFEKLMLDASTQGLLSDTTRSFGVYYDDPQSVPQDELRAVACISMPNLEGVGEAYQQLTIPNSQCVSVLHKGPYAELEKPYNWLFGEHVPNSGYEMLDFPPFEEYLNDAKNTPPNELLTRIYCLVQR